MSNYQDIYQVGYKLFGKYGYKNVSVSQIASKAGVAKGTFYNSFSSKESLYIQIMEDVFEGIQQHLLFLKDEFADLEERFYNYLYSAFFFYEENTIIFNLAKENRVYFSKHVDKQYIFDNIKSSLFKLFDEKEIKLLKQKDIDILDIMLVAKALILLIGSKPSDYLEVDYESRFDKYISVVTKGLFEYQGRQFRKIDCDTIRKSIQSENLK